MRPLPVSPTNNRQPCAPRLRAARKAHGYTLDHWPCRPG